MRALDLFCGAGGASMGLHRAGFDVTGVDLYAQPNYPFKFIRADATWLPFRLTDYDFVWASPPCQEYSTTVTLTTRVHPDLISPVRAMLTASGLPFVIENVPGAPLINPVMLCGTMFGLKLKRHRNFETNFGFRHAMTCGRHGFTNSNAGYSAFSKGAEFITVAGKNYPIADGKIAMGIDWMTNREYELSQAIPPAYSQCIAEYYLQHVHGWGIV